MTGDRHRIAAGRVAGEVAAVEVDQDRAEVERDSLQDRGDRIRDRVDLGRFRVDVEGVPDDHVADVERPGDRRGDDREAERGALVGTGQIGVAVDVVGGGAGAGADVDGADLGGGRAARVGELLLAGLAGRGGERRVGAVGDPGELREQALGQGRVDAGQLLGAVGTGELQGEGRVEPRRRFEGAGFEDRRARAPRLRL